VLAGFVVQILAAEAYGGQIFGIQEGVERDARVRNGSIKANTGRHCEDKRSVVSWLKCEVGVGKVCALNYHVHNEHGGICLVFFSGDDSHDRLLVLKLKTIHLCAE
jgi:hypothetical protein